MRCSHREPIPATFSRRFGGPRRWASLSDEGRVLWCLTGVLQQWWSSEKAEW